MVVKSGTVRIGTASPQNTLSVNGVIDSGYTAGSGEIRSYHGYGVGHFLQLIDTISTPQNMTTK